MCSKMDTRTQGEEDEEGGDSLEWIRLSEVNNLD
jgi:hypothetical protein